MFLIDNTCCLNLFIINEVNIQPLGALKKSQA